MREVLKIIAFSIACAVVYGILHDQITAHVSIEYFTVAHPPVFPTTSPFWLAIGWGIIATWWVGLLLGTMLALSARLGTWPKIGFVDLRLPVVVLMAISGALAMAAGAAGWILAEMELVDTIGRWSDRIEAERHSRFAFAAWAHATSYAVGATGGLLIAIRVLLMRRSAV